MVYIALVGSLAVVGTERVASSEPAVSLVENTASADFAGSPAVEYTEVAVFEASPVD